MFAISEMIQAFETVFEFSLQAGPIQRHFKAGKNSLSPFQVPMINSDFPFMGYVVNKKKKVQTRAEHTSTHIHDIRRQLWEIGNTLRGNIPLQNPHRI